MDDNKPNDLVKKIITPETKVWTPNLDVSLPIYGEDIRGFERWVNWRGFSEAHKAYAFAAYIDEDERCVLGLPAKTPVRAVADGIVTSVLSPDIRGEYSVFITIEHGEQGSGMISRYNHVHPSVEYGQEVKKGEVIATLYKDKGKNKGRLVHLCLRLKNGVGTEPSSVDPSNIFEDIGELVAEPQGKDQFDIIGYGKQPKIYIANFKKLRIKEG